MELSCPVCRSTDVRRVSLIFKHGTSTLNLSGSTLGIGAARGHLGIGVGETATSGSQQSLLAQELAPPRMRRPEDGRWLLMLGVTVSLIGLSGTWGGGAIVFGLFIALIGGALFKQATDWNKREYPELQARWERSFLCLRCGGQFEASV